jgi:hypothetical protein
MHTLLIIQGAQAPNVALTLNRVALGAFFAIGGFTSYSTLPGTRH